MHPSSIEEMKKFAALLPLRPLKVGEVGSQDGGYGGYRPLFSHPEWSYLGMDVMAGKDVDFVLASPYDWANVAPDSFDVVISGQTIEHVEDPFEWMKSIARILRPGGLACVIGPHTWEYHPCPLDCWRIFPEGMRYVMVKAGLGVLKTYMNDTHDTVGIATKGTSTSDIANVT